MFWKTRPPASLMAFGSVYLAYPKTIMPAEVAASILANVIVRRETLGDTQKLDWIFNKEVRESLDSFKC